MVKEGLGWLRKGQGDDDHADRPPLWSGNGESEMRVN